MKGTRSAKPFPASPDKARKPNPKLEDRGPDAAKIELEKRLDANADLVQRAKDKGG